ncbi:MAG: VCBS domain-containing protein, partial [Granulosicoccus sp.]
GDAAETAGGTLSISDVDDDDNPSFADVAATAGDNAYGSFVLSGGTWTYTLDQSAVQDQDGGDSVTDTITYTASDGASQQVTVTIAGSNDASVITGTTTGAVAEGNVGDAAETASGTLIVSDVDDDDTPDFADVTTTLGDNAYGAFELSSGMWTYTLDQATVQALIAGDNVTDTITYTASDGTSQQITVMITGSNDASVVNFGTAALVYTENASAVPVSSGLTVSDADSANLTGAVVRITGNYVDGEDELAFVTLGAISGSFISATGTLTLTGTASVSDYQTALRSISYENTSEAPTVGTRAVSLTVNDGSIDSAVLTRDIVIVSVNDAPTITSDGAGTAASISVDENQSAVTTVTATDLDADGALTYSLGGKDASAFNIDSASGILTFNSAPDYEANATYEVDVIVTDNGITPLSDRQTLTVTVIDVDDDLRVAEDLLSAREDSPLLFDPVVELLANDFDPKGGALKLQSFGQPVNGTISETSSGLLEYQPNADFNGLDYFDYTVEDEAGNLATARVSIDVEAVNDPPVLLPESVDGPGATPGVNIDAVEASDGNVNIVENATVAGQVLAIDADGDVFTFSLEGLDAGLFEINSSTGELRPLAPLDFEAPLDIDGDNQYELEILVTDSNGEQNRVALGVTTVDTNEPPQFMESRFVLEEGFSGELGRLSAIDLDAGDELVFELISTGATLSGVNLLTDGRLITDGLLPGTYELEVLVRDSGNLVSIGYVVLQVNPLADAEPQLEAAVGEANRFTPTLSPATHYVNTSIKYVPVVSESVPDSSPYSVALFTSPSVFEVPPLQFSEPLGEQEWTPVATDFLRLMAVFIDRSFDLYEVQTTSSPLEAVNWSFTPTSEQMMKIIDQIRASFDEMQDQERDAERMMSLLVSFGTVTLSVSFAVWLLASRILLAAAFLTSSLWRTVDPVPVLLGGRDKEEEEDEVDDDNGPDDSLDDLGHRVSNG